MSKPPAFQLYCNDWLSSPTIIAMTPLQELAYFRMLLFMWQSGDCSIPKDPELMGRLTRTDANTCSIVFEQAMSTHPKNDTKLTNNRLLSMWEERLQFIESRKRAGVKSGKIRKKAGKNSTEEHNRTRVQSSSNTTRTNANSSSSSSDEDDSDSSERKNRRCTSEQDPEFEEFWKIYPRKERKGNARKAWVKAIKKTDVETILIAADRYAKQKRGKDQEFVAHPATWLNGEGWDDETLKPKDPFWYLALPPEERDAVIRAEMAKP